MTNISDTIPHSSVSSEHQAGGAKKKRSTKPKTTTKKASSSKKTLGKKGGALIDDVKNLAVPFAILLAKQGLKNLFDKKEEKPKKKTDKKKAAPAAKASKPASTKRRTSIAGGSACTAGCGMSGGTTGKSKRGASIQTQFDSIAREIEQFLQKY